MFNAYQYVREEARKAMIRNMLAAQFMRQPKHAESETSAV